MLDGCSQRHTHAGQRPEKDEVELGVGKVALSSKLDGHTDKHRTQQQNEEELMPMGAGGRDGGHSKPGHP